MFELLNAELVDHKQVIQWVKVRHFREWFKHKCLLVGGGGVDSSEALEQIRFSG
jgi:hypothetical protein